MTQRAYKSITFQRRNDLSSAAASSVTASRPLQRPGRGATVATLFAPTRRWLCQRCFVMSVVVRGARPHVDTGRVSAAWSVSAAAVGLKLVDDVKRLLERAEHIL